MCLCLFIYMCFFVFMKNDIVITIKHEYISYITVNLTYIESQSIAIIVDYQSN